MDDEKSIEAPANPTEQLHDSRRPRLTITRVINACVLLDLGDDAVLTDPYFQDHWFMRFREPIGLKVEELPRLTAIVGGHGVFDHWQPRSLDAYPFKADTPVYVATRAMMKKALSAGFRQVEVLKWGTRRQVSASLELEVTPRQTAAGMKVNNYVLSAGDLRVFVGTEARDLEPLREYRRTHPGVDVALAPIDGSAFVGHPLVMNASEALEAARILGARVFLPIHYANRPVPLLLQTPGTIEELQQLASGVRDFEVVIIEPGKPWRYHPR